MANGEVWKAIPGRKGYEASTLGRIRSIDRWITYKGGQLHFHEGKILAQFTLWNGYRTTHLGSTHINEYVHRLVAKAFLGKQPKGMEVCHNNGKKGDNRLQNLRYDTKRSNALDVIRHRYEQAWVDYAAHTKRQARLRRLGEGNS